MGGRSQARPRVAELGIVLLCAIFAGCAKSPSVAVPGKPDSSAAVKPKPVPADALNPDLVSAVSAANAAPPISLKFRIEQKPLVGQPVTIELALIPAQGVAIDHIHASFQVSDGMQLASERAFDIEQPEAGVPLEHEVTVLPQQTGVLQITATVIVDSESGSLARSYAIPLIADTPPTA